MTSVSTNVKLVEAYRKEPVKVKLAPRKDMGPFAPREAILAPVLYHGTARVQVLEWQQTGGIRASKFSLSCSWLTAGQYATYRAMAVLFEKIFLENRTARKIWTTFERVRQTGFCVGFVTNSIVFFDTESVLRLPDNQFEKQSEEVAGLCLRRRSDSAVIPFDSSIAAVSFLPGSSPNLEVFNRTLWDANFNVPPPSLEGAPAWTTFEIEPFPAEFFMEIFGDPGMLE